MARHGRKMRSPTTPPGHALYEALTGRSPRSEPKTTQAMAQFLQKALGGTKAAARAVGVSPRTIERWAKGEMKARNRKGRPNLDKLTQAVRTSRIRDKPRQWLAASARRDPQTGQAGAPKTGLSFKGYVVVSAPTVEHRWVHLGPYIPAGSTERIIDALITGGPDAAAAELQDLVNTYYHPMELISIEEIKY